MVIVAIPQHLFAFQYQLLGRDRKGPVRRVRPCKYAQRDTRLAESLIELAEKRSIARALRFAGYGVEYAGPEEVLHVPNQDTVAGANSGEGASGYRAERQRQSHFKTVTLRQRSSHAGAGPGFARTVLTGEIP